MSTKGTKRSLTKPLTEKQREFVRQYVLLRDATKAAIAAGFKPNNARSMAYRLLQQPSIKREVRKAFHRIGVQYENQLSVAMQELFHCVTRRASDLIDPDTGVMRELSEMPERIDAAIDGYEETTTTDDEGNVSVKRKVKLVSKASAIDMAMKINGSYAPTGNSTTVNVDARKLTVLRIPDNGRGPVIEHK